VLTGWGHRRNGFEILQEVNRKLGDIPGVRAFANMPAGFGGGRGGSGKPINFVLKGPSYETLVEWRNKFVDAINADNPGINQIDWDYKETQQQFRVSVDYSRASDLGVTVQEIGSTLQTMLGSKRVGTFVQNGEERSRSSKASARIRQPRRTLRTSMSVHRARAKAYPAFQPRERPADGR